MKQYNHNLDNEFVDFLKFYKKMYIQNILDNNLNKSIHVENSVFSVNTIQQKSRIDSLKSSIKSFMFA